MTDAVFLTDVTLRDGLQSESAVMPTPIKLEIAQMLAVLGSNRLEITSFASPKWVPQFSDAEAFCEGYFKNAAAIETMAFVPNGVGASRALRFPIPWLSTFIAASEPFNQKNTNQSIDALAVELVKVGELARAQNRRVRVYISTVFGCPYQGAIGEAALKKVFTLVKRLGPDEVALSDTIGVATPALITNGIRLALEYFEVSQLALHLHDTYGLALVNCETGWNSGIRRFDGSTAGIGGCPYAKGASGNVALEGIAYWLFRSGRSGGSGRIPIDALKSVLEKLRGCGVSMQSPIGEVIARGGIPYGC